MGAVLAELGGCLAYGLAVAALWALDELRRRVSRRRRSPIR